MMNADMLPTESDTSLISRLHLPDIYLQASNVVGWHSYLILAECGYSSEHYFLYCLQIVSGFS